MSAKVARHFETPRVAGRRKTPPSWRDRIAPFTTGANGDRRQRFAALLGKSFGVPPLGQWRYVSDMRRQEENTEQTEIMEQTEKDWKDPKNFRLFRYFRPFRILSLHP
jgi:hypothetical protein